MADDRLAEIRARVVAATPAPWRLKRQSIRDRIYRWEVFAPVNAGHGVRPIALLTDGFVQTDADAELIARAPADLAWAVAEVERLRAALAELVEVADLRGDSTLPHPADDPKPWTARMQTAWDEARKAGEDAVDG